MEYSEEKMKISVMIQKLKGTNKERPQIVEVLEDIEKHMYANTISTEDINAMLKYEISRHPEWNYGLHD